MSPTFFWIAAFVSLVLSLPAAARAPAPFPRPHARTDPLAGKWTVTFSNGVVETCEVRTNGTASVVEPRRSSAGKARARNGGVVIFFRDERVERWTVKGQRVVVEHWFPASNYPSGGRVLGVARRSR